MKTCDQTSAFGRENDIFSLNFWSVPVILCITDRKTFKIMSNIKFTRLSYFKSLYTESLLKIVEG